jgi:hypothetical protein
VSSEVLRLWYNPVVFDQWIMIMLPLKTRFTKNHIFQFIVVLALTLGLAACSKPRPVETTLAALSNAQIEFDGKLVSVNGTLRTFDEPRHYWIENLALNRVALEGDFDLSSKVGQTIKVRGRFFYRAETGRRIEVEEIDPLP